MMYCIGYLVLGLGCSLIFHKGLASDEISSDDLYSEENTDRVVGNGEAYEKQVSEDKVQGSSDLSEISIEDLNKLLL